MIEEQLPFEDVKNKIAQAETISILSHLNPDADTLGTSLGIYALLSKDKSKKVEIVNASNALPMYLDFMPHYKKIKHKMAYTNSLIIACDCGSIDRLGFDLSGRDIINIDHHQSNTKYGSINVIVPQYASASQVAYTLFNKLYPVCEEAAICFYVALFSDTRYFTTSAVNAEVFAVSKSLVDKGAKPNEAAYHFTQRRSLASIRILEKALASLTLHEEAKVATLFVTKEDIAVTGAKVADMEGIVDYGRSLATVEVAVFAMEIEEGVRISLRSKSADISQVALAFGGGGHKVAAGFTLKDFNGTQCRLQTSIDIILEKIKTLKLCSNKL